MLYADNNVYWNPAALLWSLNVNFAFFNTQGGPFGLEVEASLPKVIIMMSFMIDDTIPFGLMGNNYSLCSTMQNHTW